MKLNHQLEKALVNIAEESAQSTPRANKVDISACTISHSLLFCFEHNNLNTSYKSSEMQPHTHKRLLAPLYLIYPNSITFGSYFI